MTNGGHREKKILYTFSLYLIFFGGGLTYNIIAPTLTDLKTGLNVTDIEMAGLFTSRSAGYMIGAPLGAILFAQCNRQLVISVLVAIMAVGVTLLPLFKNVAAVFTVAGLSGLANGGMEAGVNVWLLEIWKDKSCPYMQALHLCFALGCATAPLITVKFLANDAQGIGSSIHIPYAITGAVLALASAVIFSLYFIDAYQVPRREEAQETEMEPMDRNRVDKVVEGLKNRLPCKRNVNATDIVTYACLTMLFYSGMSIIYSQFMPTYLQYYHTDLSKQTASYISSVMYYASTISRAISVPLAMKLKPEFFVYMNCFMLGSGSLVQLLFGRQSLAVTWAGNVLIGIGSASVSAPMYSFLKQHMEVTNTIGSIFVFSSGLTSVLYPILVGYFIRQFPEFLLYLNLINIALTVFFFSLIYLSVRNRDTTNRRVLSDK
ncbi:Major facilitator superfamily domain-containing protein 4B [Halotydeus destructor]|nr:Major facilitator superfamily domain-containing protein 4B [Halotydeus destructor]